MIGTHWNGLLFFGLRVRPVEPNQKRSAAAAAARRALRSADRRKTIDGSKAWLSPLLAGLVETGDATRLGATRIARHSRTYRYHVTKVGTPAAQRALMVSLVDSVTVTGDHVAVLLRLGRIDASLGTACLSLTVLSTMGRRKASLAVVVPGSRQPQPDRQLIALVARARAWMDALRSRMVSSLAALSGRQGVKPVQVRRTLPLALLASKIVAQIAHGRQLAALTAARLRQVGDLPAEWAEQGEAFG